MDAGFDFRFAADVCLIEVRRNLIAEMDCSFKCVTTARNRIGSIFIR